MNKFYDDFHNLFSVSKTLKFELIPIGKTKEYFEERILEQDEEKSVIFQNIKKYCDEYHKSFIEECLHDFNNQEFSQLLSSYNDLFFKNTKTEAEEKEFNVIKEKLRKIIASRFNKNEKYKGLFGKELIKDYLKEYYSDNDAVLNELALFEKFTTYFSGYNQNRQNMYSNEEKHTAISYRLINENLPTYIKNIKAFNQIKSQIPTIIEQIKSNLNIDPTAHFDNVENYIFALSQKQIEKYNLIIAGKSTQDNKKIKGINEIVNEYNQKNNTKLPKLKELYKQILSETNSASFVLDLIQDDVQAIEAIVNYYDILEKEILNKQEFKETLCSIHKYNLSQIYINNDTQLSKNIYGDWEYIKDLLRKEWDDNYAGKTKKGTDKYQELKDKENEKIKQISIFHLEELIKKYDTEQQNYGKVFSYFEVETSKHLEEIKKKYELSKDVLSAEYENNSKKLLNNPEAIEKIKDLLDAIKSLQEFVRFLIPKTAIETDSAFYNNLNYEILSQCIALYNKIRNYLTKKPYSIEKFKLNFSNPDLLGGWPVDREIATSSVIFRKDNLYYLGILDKTFKKNFKNLPSAKDSEDILEKMYYLQVADPSKDVQNLLVIDGVTVKKNGQKDKVTGENHQLEELKNKHLPEDINKIRINRSYSRQSENFNKSDLSKFIEYYKQRAIEYWSNFNFIFKNTEEYKDFREFTDDINQQAYQIYFSSISKAYIEQLVQDGKLYLFQIYNKDFSEFSKGTPNLHTLYWKALFDEDNLKNVVYKLNGKAEIFYRRKSIEGKITHPKNKPILNKNPNTDKKESVFEYDLIKNKRYSVDKFQFHVPLTMNFKAIGENKLNDKVKAKIKNFDDIHVIGIDRGERHLLYISVINSKGEIVEQFSLNEINNEYKNRKYTTNYHELLDRKEKERNEARISWGTIENIKELKEGYMSQVVHKLTQLMLKYNAVVALEDLNSGFKNSRKKVEKQVYDKFETKFISKLSYLLDKQITDKCAGGGILNAFQLASTDIKNSKQNGAIFYIPAWNTSKIDPITGFVNLFDTRKINKDFVEKFNLIKFNEKENYFEFDFDYSNFSEKSCGKRKKWTLCTIGERVRTYRNPNKNSNWDNETVDLTKEFKNLFEKYQLDISNLKNEILEKANTQFFNAVKEKDGFYGFVILFKLLVQLRNSVTGTEIDYMISPVKDKNGNFYDTRSQKQMSIPENADANGAYNIARKGLMLIERIKKSDDKLKIDYAIKNSDWLTYVQSFDE